MCLAGGRRPLEAYDTEHLPGSVRLFARPLHPRWLAELIGFAHTVLRTWMLVCFACESGTDRNIATPICIVPSGFRDPS